ncbi:regulatory protein GemA [Shewanella sp. SW36]|uniref:gp16 family protein n=1 Tax=unclassified Shewanella TaxID=196818 RepID=UPI0021D9DD0C|nr:MULTISPECIES: regulatory protein GemA [unclassified Shewanella]MCU7976938.1 regulatory protein GemA [Shewanella sp. SW36]MCU7992178.1 regulatory protein GemA [Shewanella sp. SW1]MCU8054481.1 regulatory protein GemA [Shewanella sp. SM43]
MLDTNQKAPVHANAKAHPVAQHKKRLITLINVAKGSLQLDEVIYRAMLKNATGKDSLRAMNLPELEQALEVFKQKGFKPIGSKQGTTNNKTAVKRRLSPAAGKSKLASIDKIRAIWITMGHHLVIQDNSESALDAYVRRMTLRSKSEGVDATAWMTEQQAYKVLESLKNWHKRVLIERIIARGERLKMNRVGTRPANYEVIVAQYEGHGHE